MKTKFDLVKWPNKKRTVEIEAEDSCVAVKLCRKYYPTWDIFSFAPIYVPTIKNIPDPFPSSFDIPKHLMPLLSGERLINY